MDETELRRAGPAADAGPAPGGGEAAPESKSWSVAELVYGVLFRPAAAMAHIVHTRAVKPALVVALAVYAFQGLLLAASLPADLAGLLPTPGGVVPAVPGELRVSLGLPALVAFLAMAVVSWFLSTAVFHLLAGFMGHTGSGPALFAGLGFAALPLAFGAAGDLVLGNLAGLGSLATLAVVAGLGWNLVLVTMALRETYRIPGGRAAAILLLPLAVMAGIIIMITVVLITAALPLTNYFGAPSL